MADTIPPTPENPEVAHEQGDVNVKAVLWFAAGLVAFAIVLHLGLAWMYFSLRSAEDRAKRSDYPKEFSEDTDRLPKTPRLEGIKGGERLGGEVEVSHEVELDRFDWVDEKKGIVSIPIGLAFERLLAKKPKARGEKEGSRWRDRGEAVPHDANSGRGTKEEEQ
ncbi:MAG: hypothetical protein HYS12_05220 [Planctomycetes bacterium]|nr:hypothetical protein [Planctomycetota bacterium]